MRRMPIEKSRGFINAAALLRNAETSLSTRNDVFRERSVKLVFRYMQAKREGSL